MTPPPVGEHDPTHRIDHAAEPVKGPPEWPLRFGQLVTLVAGVFFVVVGIVALTRTGIPQETVTDPHVVVGWLDHTPLLAIIHLLLGAALLSIGWSATVEHRPSFLALVAIIFGLVVFIEPDALHPSLGVHRAHGVTYLAVGALHLLSGLLVWLHPRMEPPHGGTWW